MTYLYRNDTTHTICYRNDLWLPGKTIETTYSVPDELWLTCLQMGNCHDPVIFHDDVLILAGQTLELAIEAPTFSHNVALSIQCMTPNSGVECRLGYENNKPIPIDARTFSQTLDWSLCSRIFLHNSTDNEAVISITALEVIS